MHAACARGVNWDRSGYRPQGGLLRDLQSRPSYSELFMSNSYLPGSFADFRENRAAVRRLQDQLRSDIGVVPFVGAVKGAKNRSRRLGARSFGPTVDKHVECARENPRWGYPR